MAIAARRQKVPAAIPKSPAQPKTTNVKLIFTSKTLVRAKRKGVASEKRHVQEVETGLDEVAGNDGGTGHNEGEVDLAEDQEGSEETEDEDGLMMKLGRSRKAKNEVIRVQVEEEDVAISEASVDVVNTPLCCERGAVLVTERKIGRQKKKDVLRRELRHRPFQVSPMR